MSEKFKLDRKIGFQNMFYTKCINVIIDSIGPSIILRGIFSADIGQSLKILLHFTYFECGYLEERIHPNRMGAVSHTPTGEG